MQGLEEKSAQKPMLQMPLNAWLKREGVTKPPNVEVHFSFGAHGRARDLKDRISELEKADIIFAERAGWNKGDEEIYRMIRAPKDSSVANPLKDVQAPEFDRALLQFAYDTDKYISHLDLPAGLGGIDTADDSWLRDLVEPWVTIGSFGMKEYAPTLASSLEKLQTATAKLVNESEIRHRHVTETFRYALLAAMKERPALMSKEPLRVAIIFGSSHSLLVPQLAELEPDIKITRSFDGNSQITFSYYDEYARSQMLPVERKKSATQLLTKALQETLVRSLFGNVKIAEPSKVAPHLRNIVDALSDSEWEEVYRVRYLEHDESKARAIVWDKIPEQTKSIFTGRQK